MYPNELLNRLIESLTILENDFENVYKIANPIDNLVAKTSMLFAHQSIIQARADCRLALSTFTAREQRQQSIIDRQGETGN